MGLKNKLEELKNWYFNNEAKEAKKENFIKANLVDGTEVFVDGEDFVEGAVLMIVAEGGDVPAGEGTLELEDGTILVVGAEGIITEVRKVEAEAEAEAEEEMKSEEMKAEETPEVKEEIDLTETTEADKFAAFEERIAGLESTLEKIVDGMLAKREEVNEIVKENDELKVKNEELSKAPLAKSTGSKKFERIIPRAEKNKRSLQEKIEFLKENNK